MTKTLMVAFLALCAASPALAERASTSVSRVTLFEAGLAELNFTATQGDGVRLSVPLKDVNDVLKSLTISADGAINPIIRLAGEDPVGDAFVTSPVGPGALSDIAELLGALPGTPVRITAWGESVEGRVMGVSAGPGCEDGGKCRREVNIMTDAGEIRRFELDRDDAEGAQSAGLQIAFLDPAITEAISGGLTALARSASGKMRDIDVDFGAGLADADLSYVVAAPRWKTAYRTIIGADGAVSLQAWAVIENATPEDWEDVTLTIASGAPVTLRADLHGRDWPTRGNHRSNRGIPALDTKMMPQMLQRTLGAQADMAFSAFAEAPAPVAELDISVAASEGLTDARFTFPSSITLAAGEMISVPFIAEDLDAGLELVWDGMRGLGQGSPAMSIAVSNTLPVRLPAGIMTLQGAGEGYLGDTSFPELAPGADATVSFGTEGRVTIAQGAQHDRVEHDMRLSKGLLILTDHAVDRTTYRLANPGDRAREVIILHPWAGDEGEITLSDETIGNALVREPDQMIHHRLTVSLKPGETRELTVTQRREIDQQMVITNVGHEQLLQWSLRNGSQEARDTLRKAAGIMSARIDAQQALHAHEARRVQAIEEQDVVIRLVDAMSKLTDVSEDTLKRLQTAQGAYDAAVRDRDAALEDIKRLDAELNALLQG